MSDGTQHTSRLFAESTGTGIRRGLFGLACLCAFGLAVFLGTASAAAPSVTIENASDVSFASAKASGEVDPADHETNYHFEYVNQANFEASGWAEASFAGFGSLPEGAGPTPVSEVLTGLTPGTVYHLRIRGSNSEGEEAEAIAASTFETEAVNPPSASGLAISAVTTGSAHFSGTVNSGGTGPGEASVYRLECSPECPSLEGEVEGAPVSGQAALEGTTNSGNEVEIDLDANGLEPHQSYTVTLRITDVASLSDEETSEPFITDATAPDVSTLAITGPVTATGARMVGAVNPRNSATSYWFEYGFADCASNPCASFPAGKDAEAGSANSSQIVGQDITGLQPSTTYHYRILADNGAGATVAGADQTLTTTAIPQPAPTTCPNEAIRRQQGSTHLLDCRAWEMASAVDKNRNQVNPGAILSSDGSRVLYGMVGSLPGSSTGNRGIVLATRGADGWKSRSLLPPRSEMFGDGYRVAVTTPDFRTMVAVSTVGFGEGSPESNLVRLDESDGQTLLHTFPVMASGGIKPVGSADLSHVFSLVPYEADPSLPENHAPDPENPNGTSNVFDFGTDPPALVSVMPGTNQAPSCGVFRDLTVLSGFAYGESSVSQHWVSTNGRYAFFGTRGDNCQDPVRLYRRDLVAGTTIAVSAPVVAGDSDYGFESLLKAAPDSSVVIYKSATSLDPADDEDGGSDDVDIYRWTEASGNECLTCAIPNADVAPSPFWKYDAIVSDDLSHVYFMSERSYAGAPISGDGLNNNLYVWHDGAVDFVAPATGLGHHPVQGTEVTTDGNTLVFPSFNPALDAISGHSTNEHFQFYRYDDRTGEVICLSCPADRPPESDITPTLTWGDLEVQGDTRAMSDDGSMVFFETRDALVRGDIDNARDIYEWHNGEVGLVTSGRFDYPRGGSGPRLATISPDGRHVVFSDMAPLTSDAVDSARKIYVASIGGGFPSASTPGQCSADACLAPPSPQPGSLGPGSDAFAAGGNVKAKHRTRRQKQRHHRRVVHKRNSDNRRESR